MKIGSFGDVVFEVSDKRVCTPSGVSRERKARFEEHQVQGNLPCLEFMAPELDTMSLQITLNASLGVNPLDEAKILEDYCAAGIVSNLLLAGYNWGKYVLESVGSQWRHSGPGGVHTIDMTLNMKEYH